MLDSCSQGIVRQNEGVMDVVMSCLLLSLKHLGARKNLSNVEWAAESACNPKGLNSTCRLSVIVCHAILAGAMSRASPFA